MTDKDFEDFQRARSGRKNRGVIMRQKSRSPGAAPWAYRVDGYPNGISPEELASLSYEAKRSIVLSWFLENHMPDITVGPTTGGRNNDSDPSRYSNIPEWLHGEFYNEPLILSSLGNDIEDIVYKVSSSWLPAPQRTLYNTRRADFYRHDLLERLEALEAAVQALAVPPGPGHNQPPDDPPPADMPLNSHEISDFLSASRSLRKQVEAGTPDVGKAEKDTAVIERTRSVVGRWLLKKLDVAVDAGIKASLPVAVVTVINFYGQIGDTLNLLLEWLRVLVGH